MTLDEKLKNIQARYENGNIGSYEKETEELEMRFNSDELRKTDEYQLNKIRIYFNRLFFMRCRFNLDFHFLTS